jgi:hypothetical protein
MIIQLLGVALISLLTITPTIQQNNIEQLIAPNIEIQPMFMTSPDPNRLVVINQFSFYDTVFSQAYGETFNLNQLYTNHNQLRWYGIPVTYDTGAQNPLIILDNNFYIFDGDNIYLTGNELKSIIREYYFRTRGAYSTSETFSFTQTTAYVGATSTYYTYSLSGVQGTLTGRIYQPGTANINDNSLSSKNNNITVTQNSSLLDVIQNANIQISYENQQAYENNKVLYYWLDSALPLNTIGNYSRILYARTNYGYAVNLGTINVNVIAPDTTPPTITGITGNPTNWTNQPVTITVNATDNVGLNATAYSFDGGQTYQQSNQLTTSIMQILEIRVRDTSGNIASQQVTINRIDTSSPAINLAGNWKNTFELGELANNEGLLSYLSISDNLSGLNTGLTTISNFNYNQAGSYSNIQVSATDNAGNNFVYTLPTVTITQPADNTGPIITGPTIVNRTEGNITTQGILDLYSITDISGIEPNTISIRDLNNNVITNWAPYTVGSYQLRVYARDTLNNITQYQFTLQVGEAPPPDLTPPTIVGPLLVSFEIGTYEYDSEILNLFTFSDNVGILQNQLIGEINYSELGDYQVTIRSIDTSNNITNRNIVVRIRDTVVLGNYNPLTDLLSGIFGGLLSMIFTIGTINVLGLRLLDAMGVIILGAVLLFVYKAIKGGS